ncbi:MAG: hypothetical protein VX777_07915 [Chlamydiota bacterium]|nr:hypothetical protein [Chlamydiota bacterium]
MPEEDPLDDTLFALKSLIELLEQNLYRQVDTKAVQLAEKQVSILEKKINLFSRNTEEALLDAGLKKSDVKKLKLNEIPEDIVGEFRELLERAAALKQRTVKLQEKVAEEKGIHSEGKKKEETNDKISKRQHKKKFKRLGGDDSWKPL